MENLNDEIGYRTRRCVRIILGKYDADEIKRDERLLSCGRNIYCRIIYYLQ